MSKAFLHLFIFFTVTGYSQTYYNENGSVVSKEESLYYTPSSSWHKSRDTVKSYYTQSGALYSIAVVNEAGLRIGDYIRYHENGQVLLKTSFERDQLERVEKTFYPDGSPQKEEISTKDGASLIHYWDSLGNKIIDNGNGYCVCVSNILYGPSIIEKGIMRSGFRDSLWVGLRKDGQLYFEETYAMGKLLQGKSFGKDNDSIYSYTEVSTVAAPPGGYKDLYQSIEENLSGKYPAIARRLGIEGKVYVEFIVEKTGHLAKFEIVRGIGAGCDELALQTVQSLPPWNPGLLRGQPVRQKMVLPIIFKLVGDGNEGKKKNKKRG